jgi:hypothetical protein
MSNIRLRIRSAEKNVCRAKKKPDLPKIFALSRKKGGAKTNNLPFPEKRVETKQKFYAFPKKGWRQNKNSTLSRKKGGGKTKILRFPEKRVEAK